MPGLEVAHRPERRVHVAGEDARRQAVAGLVERQHRRAVVVDRDDRQDRPEDLLLADPVHRRRRRRRSSARRSGRWPGRRRSRGRRPSTSSPSPRPMSDVRVDLVERAGVDERTDIGRVVEPGAQPELPGARLEALEQRLDDRALDDDPRARPCSAGRSCRTPTTGCRRSPGRGPRRPARRRRSCRRARARRA